MQREDLGCVYDLENNGLLTKSHYHPEEFFYMSKCLKNGFSVYFSNQITIKKAKSLSGCVVMLGFTVCFIHPRCALFPGKQIIPIIK